VIAENMLPSLHDNYLVSYKVDCEAREIKLCAKCPNVRDGGFRTIVFRGVEGYHFRNDAFGNIVLALETVPIERLLSEYGPEIAEAYRLAGAPGPWAADLASAPQALTAKGVKGFLLSSSYGLSGWVLAKEASALSG
jgi:hypothetical protein